jgi:hypothetical protein
MNAECMRSCRPSCMNIGGPARYMGVHWGMMVLLNVTANINLILSASLSQKTSIWYVMRAFSYFDGVVMYGGGRMYSVRARMSNTPTCGTRLGWCRTWLFFAAEAGTLRDWRLWYIIFAQSVSATSTNYTEIVAGAVFSYLFTLLGQTGVFTQ